MLAAIAVVTTGVSVALMATVSAVLDRRGWPKVNRRITAGDAPLEGSDSARRSGGNRSVEPVFDGVTDEIAAP